MFRTPRATRGVVLLYHSQPTGNSYKVRLLLALLARPYTAVDIDIFDGSNKQEAYLTINPLGKVPALVFDDGAILTESNAILVYLASGTTYLPEHRLLRAKTLQWMFFEQYSHLPYIGVARYYLHLLRRPPPHQDDLGVWHQRGNAALTILDQRLATSPWLVGDSLTVADIALYAYTHVAEEGGFDLSAFPSVQSWLARVRTTPGYVALHDRPSRVVPAAMR